MLCKVLNLYANDLRFESSQIQPFQVEHCVCKKHQITIVIKNFCKDLRSSLLSSTIIKLSSST